jgi:hypothetical protein
MRRAPSRHTFRSRDRRLHTSYHPKCAFHFGKKPCQPYYTENHARGGRGSSVCSLVLFIFKVYAGVICELRNAKTNSQFRTPPTPPRMQKAVQTPPDPPGQPKITSRKGNIHPLPSRSFALISFCGTFKFKPDVQLHHCPYQSMCPVPRQ